MNAKFTDLYATADYIGPGAIEVPMYQTEITDLVRRRGIFGQRIKQVPATGHPSRFFEETAIPAPTAANGFVDPRNIVAPLVTPTRVERSVPLKAIVAQINYNLFDIELGQQQSQFAYLQAKDLTDTIDGVLRTHDVALWNGNDTSLSTPTTAQYFGARRHRSSAGGNSVTIPTTGEHRRRLQVDHCADGREQLLRRSPHRDLCESSAPRPHRPRDEERVQRRPRTPATIDRRLHRQDALHAGRRHPPHPRVDARLTPAPPAPARAVLPAYIVTEDMIEYHWLSEPNPRVFQLGVPGSLASQYVVVKFGGVVVKGANYAHYQVLVDR